MRIDGCEKPHSLRDVVIGLLAAAIGVQSKKNQADDFEHGSPRRFAIVGMVAALIFIVTVYLVVQVVITAVGV
jgi:ABC-type Na+ efflux pump permease subunit